MTPQALIAQWRERAKVERADRWCNTGDALIWQAIHAHRGQLYEKCADELAASLRETPQEHEEHDLTRVDTTGDSTDSRTASTEGE